MSRDYRIVKWQDANGTNTVAGFMRGERHIDSLAYGLVELPVGAEIFEPARPKMRKVGEVR